jgi:hypothetical protein
MRKFACPHCKARIFFENTVCETCATELAFDPATMRMERLDGTLRQACANRMHGVCNWCADPDCNGFCVACDLNRVIPDLSVPLNVSLWRRIELAKHRLAYDLLRLKLPLVSKRRDPQRGLAFEFLSSATGPVTTGHADGLITLDIAEADDATREANRARLHEPYRTLLGHFRHEVGHYYWDRLVRDGPQLPAFRAVFGDETQDYAAALQKHYAMGPPPDWRDHFVSAYASSHPWEDWAESWAHFLHIVATLDTAAVLPLAVAARIWKTLDDPYAEEDFAALIEAWLPLAESINELNRSMGVVDAYPFVLSPEVIGKLHTVQMIVLAAHPPLVPA